MRVILGAAVLLAAMVGASSDAAVGPVRVEDLDGRRVDPFEMAAQAGAKATVFVFLSAQCMISNRYAPEVRRLYDLFTARGVQFWLVFPDAADSPAVITRHLRDFNYPWRALRDPQHALAKLVGATITPEAAVYDAAGRRVYLGRIDDRYIRLGLERPMASRKDVEEALSAVLAGQPVRTPTASAVGCYISDFAHTHVPGHF